MDLVKREKDERDEYLLFEGIGSRACWIGCLKITIFGKLFKAYESCTIVIGHTEKSCAPFTHIHLLLPFTLLAFSFALSTATPPLCVLYVTRVYLSIS